MPQAVRFDEYGGLDVLKVVDVPRPVPGPGQVLVQVKAAGINPGEAKIRAGSLAEIFPATFPSGEGSDLAGIVTEIGPDVTSVSPGDEVIGFTDNRASHAQYVLVEAANLTPRPPKVPWTAGGSLFVVGTTGYAVRQAVGVQPGETVVVAGATGGVGSVAVQLAKRAGATVIGLAGPEHEDWLTAHGVIPVRYGDGAADRVRAAAGHVDAFIDTHGGDNPELALDLGVKPDRINTIARFDAPAKYGVKAEGGSSVPSVPVMAELARLIAAGELEIPVAATYPLNQVREAFQRLAEGHLLGKVVLIP